MTKRLTLFDRFRSASRWLLPILVWATIALIAYHRLGYRTNSEVLDQSRYLQLAQAIRAGETLTDGNRHPLYPALLAPISTRNDSFFVSGKLLTFILGLGILAAIVLIIINRWGLGIATLVLVAVGPSFVELSSGIICESLLALFVFLTWIWGVRSIRCVRWCAAAGGAAGLCYLTKEPGSLIAAAFVLSLLVVLRHSPRLFAPRAALFLGTFLLLSAPLLLFNLRHYGEPFYNVNTKHYMWLDTWSDCLRSKSPLPTVGSYLSTHSVGEIARRELAGLTQVKGGAVLWSFLLITVAGVLVERHRLRAKKGEGVNPAIGIVGQMESELDVAFPVFLTIVHLILVAWYVPIANGGRLVYPLYPVLFSSIFRTLRSMLSAWKLRWLEWSRIAAVFLFGGGMLVLPLTLDLGNPYRKTLSSYPEVERWVAGAGDRAFLYGPSSGLAQWKLPPERRPTPIPVDLDPAQIVEMAHQRRIAYLLVDHESLENRPALGEWFAIDGAGVRIRCLPKTWEVVVKDETLPPRWILVRMGEFEHRAGMPPG